MGVGCGLERGDLNPDTRGSPSPAWLPTSLCVKMDRLAHVPQCDAVVERDKKGV